VARKSLSPLQTWPDFAFSVDSNWQKLGGSEQAASYFQLVDTNQTSVASFQSQGCSDAQKGLARGLFQALGGGAWQSTFPYAVGLDDFLAV
jgi:hypothetical protein